MNIITKTPWRPSETTLGYFPSKHRDDDSKINPVMHPHEMFDKETLEHISKCIRQNNAMGLDKQQIPDLDDL